ncbi:MAG: Rrf2 family transcriptional regulator [Desulfobacteraceae bacterium]|jgi:Rrf2 family protein
MRLTKASEYAIRCVQYLSMQKKGIIASRNEIAGAMDIPRDFLAKIAQQLSRSDILEIIKGPKGGFRLKVPPEQLNLLDVIETMTGELFFNECALRPESCSKSCTCQVYPVWVKARTQFRETLRQATFAQLIGDAKERSLLIETATIK